MKCQLLDVNGALQEFLFFFFRSFDTCGSVGNTNYPHQKLKLWLLHWVTIVMAPSTTIVVPSWNFDITESIKGLQGSQDGWGTVAELENHSCDGALWPLDNRPIHDQTHYAWVSSRANLQLQTTNTEVGIVEWEMYHVVVRGERERGESHYGQPVCFQQSPAVHRQSLGSSEAEDSLVVSWEPWSSRSQPPPTSPGCDTDDPCWCWHWCDLL